MLQKTEADVETSTVSGLFGSISMSYNQNYHAEKGYRVFYITDHNEATL